MPLGIIINVSAIVIGGIMGYFFRRHIPARIISSLSAMFGVACLAIGISLTTKFTSLPAVILALLLGTIAGELLNLEARLASFSQAAKNKVESFFNVGKEENQDEYIEKFINLLLLFCTGATGVLGALIEGMTGDRTVLLAKSVLDFFTAAIFAASMGILIIFIALPQFLVFISLFLLAGFILPLTTPALIADFTGCGGIITIMTAIRMLEIRSFKVTNALPALIIVMPISYLWAQLFA